MIDVSFDVTQDSGDKDPDAASPTLRRYHQLLWSKPLPSGILFDLDTTTAGVYLHHASASGEFTLSSDVVVPTYALRPTIEPISRQLHRGERSDFERLRCTIGAFMVFPSQRVDKKMTINGARGLDRRISDRMDLTLECIRRHYAGESSPLGDVLQRYADFFELFGDFAGYVDFFLLQDLVTQDGSGVKFFMPFENFQSPALPQDMGTYREYRRSSMEFIRARNQRIDELWGPTRATPTRPPTRTGRGREHVVMGRIRHRH